MIQFNEQINLLYQEGKKFKPIKLQFFVFNKLVVMKVLDQDDFFCGIGNIIYDYNEINNKNNICITSWFFPEFSSYDDIIYIKGRDNKYDNVESVYHFKSKEMQLAYFKKMETFFNNINESNGPIYIDYNIEYLPDEGISLLLKEHNELPNGGLQKILDIIQSSDPDKFDKAVKLIESFEENN